MAIKVRGRELLSARGLVSIVLPVKCSRTDQVHKRTPAHKHIRAM